jgi:endonuclease/exonuclease/phosphatase family metal-dependent hydrolase
MTYNIHKARSPLGRKSILKPLRELLRTTQADLVFLQEVFESVTEKQMEFLADTVWAHASYGQNATYPKGHHGNAVLSKYPILYSENQDISAHPFESRGLLQVEIDLGDGRKLPVFCVHLGLFERGRKRQLESVRHRVEQVVSKESPIVLAGDFNDWREAASGALASLGLSEVSKITNGRYLKSFPSVYPMFCLDRIYVRGLRVLEVEVLKNIQFSDHLPILVTVEWPKKEDRCSG